MLILYLLIHLFLKLALLPSRYNLDFKNYRKYYVLIEREYNRWQLVRNFRLYQNITFSCSISVRMKGYELWNINTACFPLILFKIHINFLFIHLLRLAIYSSEIELCHFKFFNMIYSFSSGDMSVSSGNLSLETVPCYLNMNKGTLTHKSFLRLCAILFQVLNLFLALLLSSFGAESLQQSQDDSEPNKLQEACDRINRLVIFIKSHVLYCIKVKIKRKSIINDFDPSRTKTDLSCKDIGIDGEIPMRNGRICEHDSPDGDDDSTCQLDRKGKCPSTFF